MKTTVEIKLNVEGFHNWPNAIKQVDFLQARHRHTFIVKCGFKVTQHDREKEIFIMRQKVQNLLETWYGIPCEFKDMSCEHIAAFIIQQMEIENIIYCSVWEENTGGAKISK